jgi:hypothetical protein
MKYASIVPVGVVVLAGLGWLLTRDGDRGGERGARPMERASNAREKTEPATLAAAPEEPYSPPGLAPREPEHADAPPGADGAPTTQANTVASNDARDPQALIARDQAIAVDTTRSIDDRVRAIRNLGSYRIMDDVEGRTPEVLAEAFWILEYADDPDDREDLLQGLLDLDDASIVAPVARVLREDLEPQVREAAAEVLREHGTDAAAAAALRQAAEEDADERVRVAASKTR